MQTKFVAETRVLMPGVTNGVFGLLDVDTGIDRLIEDGDGVTHSSAANRDRIAPLQGDAKASGCVRNSGGVVIHEAAISSRLVVRIASGSICR
jgi:hypothetical protein